MGGNVNTEYPLTDLNEIPFGCKPITLPTVTHFKCINCRMMAIHRYIGYRLSVSAMFKSQFYIRLNHKQANKCVILCEQKIDDNISN